MIKWKKQKERKPLNVESKSKLFYQTWKIDISGRDRNEKMTP